jgi:hypothetical protein
MNTHEQKVYDQMLDDGRVADADEYKFDKLELDSEALHEINEILSSPDDDPSAIVRIVNIVRGRCK